ncbi:rab-GTPase-TBC domain-containing protein [Zopfochytrium polystomum]|nr:rab-GTPase-TBC domain-containing protein [Zopfochytrium polystomum]
MRRLRKVVLADGIPDDELSSAPGLRGRIWKALIGVYKVSALEYITLVEKGRCDVYDSKIKNDTFRTLATDAQFVGRVDEGLLARLLNAFVWKVKDQPPSRLINLKFSYVQGMNVLAAPFLYVMPELDAFYSFLAFIQNSCPLYVQPSLEGVHCGIKLFDMIFKILEPNLHRYLKSKKLEAITYAFPSIMTFSACTQPLSEALKLWDFFLAYGIHLNVVCVLAQVVRVKDLIMKSPSPVKVLRTMPDLDARAIIALTLKMLPKLPDNIYDMLVRHPFDPMILDYVLTEDGGDEGSGGE